MRKKFDDLGKGKCFAAGGDVKAELKFMKDKGAPKSMIKAEKKEHGLPAFEGGGSSGGGSAGSAGKSRFVGHGAFNFGGKGGAKAKPFAEGGSIDDATRARALAWVDKRRAQQDAEGAGDASAAEPSPIALPAIKRRPAATQGPSHAPGPAPVVEQKTTTVYSHEGAGKSAPRDTTGFAETAFNAVRSALTPKAGAPKATEADAVAAANKGIPKEWTGQDQPPPAYRRMHESTSAASRYAGGGSIDGCARKGKTRGKVI
jgi:hypothetical protein